MKKRQKINWIPGVLTAFMLIFPIFQIIARHYKWQFSWAHPFLYLGILTIFQIAGTVILLKGRKKLSTFNQVLVNLMPILVIISGMVTILSHSGNTLILYLPLLIMAACAFVMTFRGQSQRVLNFTGRFLGAFLAVIVLLFLAISALMQNFGASQVVQSVDSPDKGYIAIVLDVDEGALGGSTIVEVQKNTLFGMRLRSMIHLKRRVFIGEWGMGDELDLSWMENNTLLIDGISYEMQP